MARLLDQANSEAPKLSGPGQEALGAWMLAEIDEERRWRNAFDKGRGVLEQMADEDEPRSPAPRLISENSWPPFR